MSYNKWKDIWDILKDANIIESFTIDFQCQIYIMFLYKQIKMRNNDMGMIELTDLDQYIRIFVALNKQFSND